MRTGIEKKNRTIVYLTYLEREKKEKNKQPPATI